MLCMYQNVITVLWIISIKFKISSVCSWVRMYMNVCIYACAPFNYSVSESFKDFLLCYLIFKHVNVYGYFSLLLLLHLSTVLFHCSLRVTSDDLRVFITCSLHCFRTLNQCKETLYVEFNDEKKTHIKVQCKAKWWRLIRNARATLCIGFSFWRSSRIVRNGICILLQY